jgi:hypothetical protein
MTPEPEIIDLTGEDDSFTIELTEILPEHDPNYYIPTDANNPDHYIFQFEIPEKEEKVGR